MDVERWAPLSVPEVTELLADAPFPWWVAGGWAIDLHVGRVSRHHDDVDVVVRHGDARMLAERLDGWDLHLADPPGTLRPWSAGEVPPAGVHDVWCRSGPDAPWSLQVMLDDADGEDWVYRRDRRVRRPRAELDGPASTPARRVLAPEVQLLWKSAHHRPKDDADLATALPHLDGRRRAWLLDALRTADPGHPWVDRVGRPHQFGDRLAP